MKLRILMFNMEYPPLGGGAANATFHILKELSKHKNLKIDLITSSKDSFKIKKYKNITIYKLDINKNKIHYWSLKEILTYIIKARQLAKELIKLLKENNKKYHLSHSFFAIPCGLISYSLELPYIISLRGSDVPGFNERFNTIKKIQTIIFKKICSKANKVISNSSGLEYLASKSWKGKIDIIPNGVDTKKFYPKQKKRKRNINLLCVSRLIKRKNIDYLIKAVTHLQNYKLTIIGEGPEKHNLMSLAYGTNVNVKFLGYIPHDELPEIYREHDIFILPSQFEGMSNTILEAMASGLPIITTRTGGTMELIKENGIIIEKKNIMSIVFAIEAIKYIPFLKRWGRNSRKIAKEMSWRNVTKSYIELYEKT